MGLLGQSRSGGGKGLGGLSFYKGKLDTPVKLCCHSYAKKIKEDHKQQKHLTQKKSLRIDLKKCSTSDSK